MTKKRYTVRKQSSGRAASETFYVYDLVRKGRVTAIPHPVREGAQAEADALNDVEEQHRANLADAAWVADRDAKLAAHGLKVDESGELVSI